MLYAPV
jgi:hypothetical protein